MSHCYWAGDQNPRLITGRHVDECPDNHSCRGCQPCHEPLCRVCGVTHIMGTCAECLAETRDALRQIGRMCDALPEEVEHRGVAGEAMVLLSPVADPEARGHLEASVACGRVPADWIDHADNERHPLFVLGGWRMVWADVIEDDHADDKLDLPDLVEYLDRNLHRMSADEFLPFEEFAKDLRKCHAHLEAVLHDEERGVRANVPCFDCGGELERPLTKAGFDDAWQCRKCHRRYTIAEYNFALRAALEGDGAA